MEVWELDPTSSCGERLGGQIGAGVCGAGSWRRPGGEAEGSLSEKEMKSDGGTGLKKLKLYGC